MKRNLTKFFNLIKKDKQAKTLTIIGVLMLFIFTIGYSLSMFTGGKSTTLANIKVNDLSFNITTNSGESDDRILHLQAGKTESFNVVITNLNKIDTKYELIYDVCSDSNCTSTSKEILSTISVKKESTNTEINGTINKNNSKEVVIITTNASANDYYIKLNLNAGYGWNELELANQINDVDSDKTTQIIAYVDGKEVSSFPDTCNYIAEIKGYNGNTEVELKNASVTCDFTTKEWATYYIGHASKIVVNFTPGLNPGTFAEDSWDKIAEVVRNGQGVAYEVGSEKEVEVDGLNYTVRVANNTTPDECKQSGFSETACGFVVEFVDILAKRVINNTATNKGGWPASNIRTYANGTFFAKLPSDLQEAIIDTKVISGHGSTDSNNFTSTDKIYLLSGHEVYESKNEDSLLTVDTAYNNTRQLDYYKAKEVTTSSYVATIKKYLGFNSGSHWWLRTASATYYSNFLYVYDNGDWDPIGADINYGFAPAFRIG